MKALDTGMILLGKQDFKIIKSHIKPKTMKAKRIITWATIIAMLWVVGQIQDQFCR
jgi:hypothetical protein